MSVIKENNLSGKGNSYLDLKSIYFLSNAGVVMVFSYLVLLLDKNGISKVQVGLLAIPFSASMVISNSFFGRLSDTKGRRPFLLIGLAASSLSTIFYIIPNEIYLFVLARILNGIALGIFPSSIIGVASDRKVKIGRLTAFGSIGWASGGLIGGFIADFYSLELTFVVSSFLYFLAFLTVYRMNTGYIDNTNSLNGNLINNHQPKYRDTIRENWAVYFLMILRHGSANGIWIFWAFFLTEDLGLTTTQMGVVQATNMITQFVVMSTIGDKYHPTKMYILGGLLSALSFYIFTLSSSFVEIVLTQVVLGISWAFFYVGGLRSVELKSKKTNSVATATGLYNASLSSAQIVGPFLAILLFSLSGGYTLSMIIAAIITLISTIVYIGFERKNL